MQETLKTFWKWANELLEKVTAKHGVDHTAWIVPAPFFAIWRLHDVRYLPAGTIPNSKRWQDPRRNNFKFL